MITMTSPRKTSTETTRGTCAERRESFVLTVATDGEIAAVTMPHIRKHVLIFHSYFHLRGEDRLVDSQDVKRLQLNVQEFITRLALQRLDLRLDSERHRLAGETGGFQWLNADGKSRSLPMARLQVVRTIHSVTAPTRVCYSWVHRGSHCEQPPITVERSPFSPAIWVL